MRTSTTFNRRLTEGIKHQIKATKKDDEVIVLCKGTQERRSRRFPSPFFLFHIWLPYRLPPGWSFKTFQETCDPPLEGQASFPLYLPKKSESSRFPLNACPRWGPEKYGSERCENKEGLTCDCNSTQARFSTQCNQDKLKRSFLFFESGGVQVNVTL